MHELSVSGGKYYPRYELMIRMMPLNTDDLDKGYGDRYRLILISEGHCVVQVNGRLFAVSAPALCCLSEKDHFSIQSPDEIEGTCLYFHPCVINPGITFQIDPENYEEKGGGSLELWCLRPFFLKDAGTNGVITVDASIQKRITDLMDIMNGLMENEPDNGWPCRCRSFLIEILFLLSRLHDRPKPEEIATVNTHEESVRSVMMYMSKFYNRKIRLEELSKEFHTNKTSLNERFRKATGESVMAWLISLRMQIACSLLRNTTMPVSDVAGRVGFLDDAHFLRAFKKHAGMTPTDYRNANCWMLRHETV